jgi:hypothetical protein
MIFPVVRRGLSIFGDSGKLKIKIRSSSDDEKNGEGFVYLTFVTSFRSSETLVLCSTTEPVVAPAPTSNSTLVPAMNQ